MNTSSSRSRLRILSALLVAAALLAGGSFLLPQTAFAEGASEEGKTYSVDAPPALSSTRALLVDRTSGMELYEKGAGERCYPASVTKVMTALLVLENGDLDEMVTVTEEDLAEVTWDSSVADIKAGDTLSVRDLLAGLLIPSGNDASYVLARYVAGDWRSFVDMMNERAVELGCADTHFVNPCGLHDDNHYTTARDLVLIFEEALKHPEFIEISHNATWELPATSASPARELETTDRLLDPESPVYMGDVVVAGKTGSTWEAGRCLITLAEKDGMSLIGVVLGAPMEEDEDEVAPSFYDMRSLLEWGFGAWRTGAVVSEGDIIGEIDVELSSDGDEVEVRATSEISATVPRSLTLEDLTLTPSWSGTFRAPLNSSQSIGEVSVAYGDRELGTVTAAPARTMALSIPSFLVWWVTSDISHAIIVFVVLAALFVGIGLLCNARARARRREEQRLKISAGRSFATSPASSRDKRASRSHGAPSRANGSARGGGRHMRQ